MAAPYSSAEIANEFLRKSTGITHMQLQKLVYLANAWNLVINEQPLVSDEAQAWDNGPVFRYLWDHLKSTGSRPVGKLVSMRDHADLDSLMGGDNSEPYKANLSPEERDLIDHVWKKYRVFNAFELSNMTHQPDTPWTRAYIERGRNSVILNADIIDHFRKLAIAGREHA